MRIADVEALTIREFRPGDAARVREVLLTGWAEYSTLFSDWPEVAARLERVPELTEQEAQILVAECDGQIAGSVLYVAPGLRRDPTYPLDWGLIRTLSVAPDYRRRGVARALCEACLARARRDGADTVGLHTSPVMHTALSMYLRMGFELHEAIGERHGVPYATYCRSIGRSL